MKKLLILVVLSFIVSISYAQKKTRNYYVGGLLYCKHTYFLNNEASEASYLEVTNTQNYNGKNYSSCGSCSYQNDYRVDIFSFEDYETGKSFTLYIRYIDKQTCILVFQDSEKTDDKIEIYYAKVQITN